MKALVLLHRWLGIGFCLLFAMWFASGIVMHFVRFPSLDEAARFAGLLPIDLSQVLRGPDEAAAASNKGQVRRVRLLQRADGPVYIASSGSGLVAVHANDLSDASVKSERLALDIAQAHARQRGIEAAHATLDGVADYDQWSVPNGFDHHRPLYRVALHDSAGTELYVSSTTGEVVLATTLKERVWNYLGSVAHWIYPTLLRKHATTWDETVWTLSLMAVIAAIAGAVLGIARLRFSQGRPGSPFRGWHAWHHILGLLTATFVLTWIFSGWLSMDDGLLFSRGRLTSEEAARVGAKPDWRRLKGNQRLIASPAKEVEWFALGNQFYRRERNDLRSQSISAIGSAPGRSPAAHSFLSAEEVDAFVRPISADCAAPIVVGPRDSYPMISQIPGGPVYRSVCGDVWFHVDGGTGAMMERLDPSRRSYRWLYSGLHTLDFPVLLDRPRLRDALVVILCGLGFVFSVTGAVIAWRRLRVHFLPQAGPTDERAI
ncbi:MAG: PepSY domain-containing protein [Bradyrhizobium sp.]|nr:PepSY domain-containing protein [Bradyrhizobium sp.]